ncbi:MAG: histidine phosphatase family protein [Lachnospiraceae bacterium]|nr:histidine phosphatase family protein [Lachnospiraceae bacterium]
MSVLAICPKRASDTAKAIVSEKSKIIIDVRLIERCLGDWEGVSKAEVQRVYPKAFISGKMDFYYLPKNGEHYKDMVKRKRQISWCIVSRNSFGDNHHIF